MAGEAPKNLATQAAEDTKKLQAIYEESAAKARKDAIERGKTAAVSEVKAPDSLATAPKWPDIPSKFNGFAFDQKESKINKVNGTIEQPFKLGDAKIPGTVILPENPDPKAKTTYLFNYVDNPANFTPEAQKKFLEEMKKKQGDLGNTIIVTIQTPEGKIDLDGKKVDTMTTLMANLEKFQQDNKVKFPRPDQVFHMTTKGEAEKVIKLLNEFKSSNGEKDPRIAACPSIINTDQLETSLENAIKLLKEPSKPDTAKVTDLPVIKSSSVASGSGASYGGGGGGMSSSGGGNSPSGTPSPSPSPSSAPNVSPSPTPDSTPNAKEAEPGKVDKLIYIGDSLSVGTVRKVEANEKINKTMGGKSVLGSWTMKRNGKEEYNESMLSIANKMDSSGEMESMRGGKLVILGGTNDLNREPSTVVEGLRKIWAMGRKHGLTVYACTIPPFIRSGHTSYSSESSYDKAMKCRKAINDEIIRLTGEGEANLIPLHLPLSQGGLAAEDDPNKLHDDLKAADGLHPSNYSLMARQIQKVIGEKSSGSPTIGSAEKTAKTEATSTYQGLKPYRESTPEYTAWVKQVNEDFIKSGAAPGSTKEVEFNGKKLIAKFTIHNYQAATGKSGVFQATETYGFTGQSSTAQSKKVNTGGFSFDEGVKADKSASKESAAKSAEGQYEKNKYGEHCKEIMIDGRVKVGLNIPSNFNPAWPTEIVIYATPNGGFPDKSYGKGDYLAAQSRELRNSPAYQGKNLIVACAGADTKNWGQYLNGQPDKVNGIINVISKTIVDDWKPSLVSYSIEGHSGGGSFVFNLININSEIPDQIKQINCYDSLYYYRGMEHASKLKKWLEKSPDHRLVTVTGTQLVESKQILLFNDLKTLGVVFEESGENSPNKTYKGLNGQISFVILADQHHGATVERNGFSYAHSYYSGNDFKIASAGEHSQVINHLGQIT